MSETTFMEHPEAPFPIGVEYYRAPIPKRDVWDAVTDTEMRRMLSV